MGPIERVGDINEFRADWLGRYFVGRTFVHFCADAGLYGTVFWGRPNAEDVALLVRAMSVELGPPAMPHVALYDCRRVEGADAAAFASLVQYMKGNRQALSRQVRRLAVVRPHGFEGAVVAGFFEVVDPPTTKVRIFAQPDQALAWLGRPAAAELVAELDAIFAAASATAPIVGALRAVLANRSSGDATPAQVARLLGISERTMQRRLSEAGTSFRAELTAVRINAAKRLLLDTDAPLTTIALEVGFGSLQRFSTIFRDVLGSAPKAWRERARKGIGARAPGEPQDFE